MTTTSTTPSTPRLSEVARHLVVPDGITTSVYPKVRRRLAAMRVAFDPWQEGAATVALGCRSDGKFAATVDGVVWSIPRQVGKTFTVGNLLIALALELPGLRVVWTSHHGRTTTNTFRSMQGMVRRPEVWRHVEAIRTANGEQEIRFTGGSIIMFGAREQGFGRGMDAVDILVFDEAQILDLKALEDMVPATNQARNPHGGLVFLIGTPPRPADNGEAFKAKRAQALSGEASGIFYVEMSADAEADLDDREQWGRANPSFPLRTPVESMLRMRSLIPDDDSWRREALGVWDQVRAAGVIPAESWEEAKDPESVPIDRFSVGVEVGPDLTAASVALAGQREDNAWHVALEADQHTHGKGVSWLVPYVQALVDANPQLRTVVVDVGGPVKALVEQRGPGQSAPWFFTGTKVRVQPIRVNDLGATCSTLLSGVVTGDIRHIDQPQLSTAALSAGKRALGDTGMWVWSRKSATSDITPIQATTLALHGAQTTKTIRPMAAAGNDGSVTVL